MKAIKYHSYQLNVSEILTESDGNARILDIHFILVLSQPVLGLQSSEHNISSEAEVGPNVSTVYSHHFRTIIIWPRAIRRLLQDRNQGKMRVCLIQ